MYTYKKKLNKKNCLIVVLLIYSLAITLQVYSCNKLAEQQNDLITQLRSEKAELEVLCKTIVRVEQDY